MNFSWLYEQIQNMQGTSYSLYRRDLKQKLLYILPEKSVVMLQGLTETMLNSVDSSGLRFKLLNLYTCTMQLSFPYSCFFSKQV